MLRPSDYDSLESKLVIWNFVAICNAGMALLDEALSDEVWPQASGDGNRDALTERLSLAETSISNADLDRPWFYATKTRNMTRKIISTKKTFMISHRLDDTLRKYFSSCACAESTLDKVSSTFSSIRIASSPCSCTCGKKLACYTPATKRKRNWTYIL